MNKEYPRNNYDEYRPSRNPYFQKLQEAEKVNPLIRLDASTEQYRGKWREHFGLAQDAILELELGCYHGETLSALAKQSPERGFLGVEWKYKQSFIAAKKAGDQGLTNIRFLRANIARLPWIVAPGEVNRVIILFPDPWSKRASHQKWRVFNTGFFRTLACLLSPGAQVFIKTDHKEYSEYIEEAFQESGAFFPLEQTLADQTWERIPPTPFQKIFLRQGNSTFYSFALVRNNQAVAAPEIVRPLLEQ